jgi:hypothetical protein
MIAERKFVIDIDDGKDVFVLLLDVEEKKDEESMLDSVYEIVSGYLQLNNIEYTYFNVINVTEVKEVVISNLN